MIGKITLEGNLVLQKFRSKHDKASSVDHKNSSKKEWKQHKRNKPTAFRVVVGEKERMNRKKREEMFEKFRLEEERSIVSRDIFFFFHFLLLKSNFNLTSSTESVIISLLAILVD